VDAFKEWELETRIKKLEGGGLDNLMANYNKKIDSIFSGAIDKLDVLSVELMTPEEIRPEYHNAGYYLNQLAARGQSGSYDQRGLAQAQQGYGLVPGAQNQLAAQSGMYGQSFGQFGFLGMAGIGRI